MLKNKLLVLFLFICFLTTVIGCCSKDDDSDDILGNISNTEKTPVSSKTVDGKLVVDSENIHIDSKADTFSEDAVITVIEKDFSGTRSSYLTNAPKTYGIYGVMESTNPLVPSYPINDVDEPVTVKIANTIAGDVEAYYLGIRTSENEDWKFERLNEEIPSNARMNVNMVRAAKSGEFTFKTNKLNIEVALFANVRGSDKILPATVINAINTVVEAANAEKAEQGKMPVKENSYTDDMKVKVEVGGKNVSSFNLSDYIAEITFISKYSTVDKTIAGNSATYQSPKYNPGLASGKNWSHTITVNDLEGSADNINFTIKTKGKKTEEFPQNFSVTLKNKDTAANVLPFGYTDSITVESKEDEQKSDPEKKDEPEEPKTPTAPADVIASAERIKAGDSVIVTWKSGAQPVEGKEPEAVTYNVIMAKDGGKETVVAKGLTDTEWKSDVLELGVYSIKIAAVSKDGLTAECEPVIVEVVDAAFSTPVIEDLQPYYKQGEASEIRWSVVKDALDNPLKYNVRVYDSKDEIVMSSDESEQAFISLTDLPVGDYKLVVAATDGRNTSEMAMRDFKVIVPTLPVVVMNPLLKEVYKTGEDLVLSWSEVKDPLDKPVSYKVVLISDVPEHSAEINAEGTSWNGNTLPEGNYSAKVVASNGEDSSESEAVNFAIKSAIPTAPLLNPIDPNVFRKGDLIFIAWAPSTDPFNKIISYDLYLYTGDTPSAPVAAGLKATMWVSNTLATGTYSIKVVASNGTESNETVVPEAFTVMNSSRASLSELPGSAYSSEIYTQRPEFFVEISEKNFDENEISSAINVEGVAAADVNKEWIDGKLKISFNNDLTLGQGCKISMAAVKDKYDTEIVPFADKSFNVIPFPGSGTEADPFIPGPAEADCVANDGKLALISGLNTEVGVFKGMVFSNASINADGTARWNGLNVSNIEDDPVVEIPDTDLWPASKANMVVNMTFDGTVEGKTYKFATTDRNYSTESGAVISVGDGSESKPYLVYTPGQFDDLRNYYSGNFNFKQVRDINLEGYLSPTCTEANGFSRIGGYGSSGFKGIYDGCGHVVKKLRMLSNYGDLALFGGLASPDTVVKNLGLEDVYICAKGPWVAAFAAESYDGTLENCYATGIIRSERSLTSNQTSGTSGGLMGKMSKGSIIGCHFSGTVYGSIEYSCNDVGGIVGRVDNWDRAVLIKDCYVVDSTISGGSSTGGIVGNLGSAKSIENCYVKNTTIKGNAYNVAGFIGYFYNATIDNCYVENCTVEGKDYCGGFIGDVSGCDSSKDSVKNSYFTGSVKATSQLVGGFIGYNNGLSLNNCYVIASRVEGAGSDIGGFIGSSYCNNCTNCWAKITEVYNPSSYTGGFIGYVSGGNYTNCYVMADSVKGNGSDNGVFAGRNYGNINGCYSIGNVSGPANVGGFVGINCSTIQNCYSNGSVAGTASGIGGFAGNNSNIITNCYTTCTFGDTGTAANVGLLAGITDSGGTNRFENSFTTQTLSGGIPLFGFVGSTASIANSDSYPDGYDSSLGWDETVWDLTKPLPTLN